MSKLPPISKLTDNPLARRAAGKLREGHSHLATKAIETVLLEGKSGGQKRLSLPRKLVGLALTRVATRSVPGAILVGGALLAKHLHDKKKARDAQGAGESELLTPEPKKPKNA